MQNIESPLTEAADATAKPAPAAAEDNGSALASNYNVVRRNGKLTSFDKNKIAIAMTKAFLAVEGGQAAASTRVHETVEKLTDLVVSTLTRRQPDGGTFQIEDIQDQVELALMRNGEQKIARAYVLYREERAAARAQSKLDKSEQAQEDERVELSVKLADGSLIPLDTARLKTVIDEACNGLESVSAERVYNDTVKNLFDGVAQANVSPTAVMSARGLIDREPEYSQVAARLLLDELRSESLGFINDGSPSATFAEMAERYGDYFANYVKKAADLELLDRELLKFDLEHLGKAL
ncbi:MAG: ATP cone domain-containing protein, partial [Gammaproteobacteria bacterium]